MDKKGNAPSQQKRSKSVERIRESRIESAFVEAVKDAGGLALKFTSQSMNGVPDRLILFEIGKCAFVELKAPGKQMRPLQRKRRKQLEELGFPVFCVDDFDQIAPVIHALQEWSPGEPFPTGVGAEIPEIEEMTLPEEAKPPDETGEEAKPMDATNLEQVEQAVEQVEQPEQVEQEKARKFLQAGFRPQQAGLRPTQPDPEPEQLYHSTPKGGDAT